MIDNDWFKGLMHLFVIITVRNQRLPSYKNLLKDARREIIFGMATIMSKT